MSKLNLPDRAAYIDDVSGIKSINPKWHRAVMYWAGYMRRADWAVDCAAICEHTDDEQKYLALEERYWDKTIEIESYLPKRELANAAKQLMAACNGGTAAG
jgi:hypothetical protein